MRNILIGLLMSVSFMKKLVVLSIGCLALLTFLSFESNAQSRGRSSTAGYCPQGTHPKAIFGPNANKVPNPATDCVPDGGGSSAQKQQKK